MSFRALAPLSLVFLVVACSSSGSPELDMNDDAARSPDPPAAEHQAPPALDTGAGDAGPVDASTDGAGPGDAGPVDAAQVCTIAKPPHVAYLKAGLHPAASDALVSIGVSAGRIIQTIGNAVASAGTHAEDGVADGHPYSAATDFSVKDMTDAEVSVFLDQMTAVGFVPYFRNPGHDGWPSTDARHVHAVWVGAPMKLSLRAQVRDWHLGKNGLASHTNYTFKTWSPCWREAIWARYLTANPATS
jgi:hypothetical protein